MIRFIVFFDTVHNYTLQFTITLMHMHAHALLVILVRITGSIVKGTAKRNFTSADVWLLISGMGCMCIVG
jgi:hypothetical protein